ncbi:MAG: hypothetical protein GX139_10320 [Armatimonadetes bacterium]|nr:hypothetical protein [Armatimonadota bacterium]
MFGGSTDANDFIYEVKLDDGGFEAAASPIEFESLIGSHTVYVRAVDEAGNISEVATQQFAMDSTPPTIDSVTSVAATNTSPIVVNYSVSDSESGVKQVTLWAKTGIGGDWAATLETSSNANGSFDFAVSEEDEYFFAVVAEDNVGNVTDEPTGYGATSTVYDITPPTVAIGNPSVSVTDSGPVTYEITIDGADEVTLADGDVTLDKGRSADAATVAVSGEDLTSRLVTISGITGNGTLGISIAAGVAQDAAGNESIAVGPSDAFSVLNHVPSYGLSNKAAWDPIIIIAAADNVFTIWGKVTVADADSFTVDDGSGLPVKVIYSDHGFGNGDFVSATGTLDVSGPAPVLNALVTNDQLSVDAE